VIAPAEIRDLICGYLDLYVHTCLLLCAILFRTLLTSLL
jgi:hypothetical protein